MADSRKGEPSDKLLSNICIVGAIELSLVTDNEKYSSVNNFSLFIKKLNKRFVCQMIDR